MEFKLIHLIVASLAVTTVCSAPANVSPNNPFFELDPFIWGILCTSNFPVEPRREDFPLRMVITPDPAGTYEPNQEIRVRLEAVADDFQFAAFLLRARVNLGAISVGTWQSGENSQAISCAHPQFVGSNYVAQRDATLNLRSHEIVWRVPATPNNYVFELKTMEELGSYWVDQLSPVLRVV